MGLAALWASTLRATPEMGSPRDKDITGHFTRFSRAWGPPFPRPSLPNPGIRASPLGKQRGGERLSPAVHLVLLGATVWAEVTTCTQAHI